MKISKTLMLTTSTIAIFFIFVGIQNAYSLIPNSDCPSTKIIPNELNFTIKIPTKIPSGNHLQGFGYFTLGYFTLKAGDNPAERGVDLLYSSQPLCESSQFHVERIKFEITETKQNSVAKGFVINQTDLLRLHPELKPIDINSFKGIGGQNVITAYGLNGKFKIFTGPIIAFLNDKENISILLEGDNMTLAQLQKVAKSIP